MVTMDLYETKLIVRCAIARKFALGLYLFEQATSTDMKMCSIRHVWYTTILQNYVISEFQQRNIVNGSIWMQDSAPPDATMCVQQVLQQHFGDRVISHNFALSWSLQSSDLTPMNFWFRGYLKSKVHRSKQ